MLRRKIYDDLVEWKKTPDHKSLIIKGPRQIGKTFIIREFARNNYPHYVEINFISDPSLSKIFTDGGSVEDIVFRINSIVPGAELEPGALLFLDEIQECPEARRMVKSFTENGLYDVVASGSMLGVSESRLGIYRKSAPMTIGVGYEDERNMHALDFEEFLWARGVPQTTIDNIRNCIRTGSPIDGPILEMMKKQYRAFIITGGMPEAVMHMVSNDSSGFVDTMDRILSAIREDINKYNNGSNVIKTRQCFESIPSQLGDTNKKFTFSRIIEDTESDNATKQKYFDNTEWLGAAGYGNFCYLLRQTALSLKANENIDQYRIYLFDTGMLTHMYGPAARMAIMTGDNSYNQGAIAENFVAECLVKSGIQPRYYRRSNGDARMELDFVIELGSELCVIEVKSGKHREYRSISKTLSDGRIGRRVVLEDDNIHVDGYGIEHYPLFAAAFIKDMVRPKEGFDEYGIPIGGI